MNNTYKILVIGSCGSGKSTLSIKLSEILKINVFHLDKLFWSENLEENDIDVFDKKIKDVIMNNDNFIIDGDYINTLEYRIKYSNIIIWLNIPRFKCILNVLKRFVKYKKNPRKDIASGCVETIDFNFLKYVWNYPKRSKQKTLNFFKKYSDKKVIELKSIKEIELFLENLNAKKNFDISF